MTTSKINYYLFSEKDGNSSVHHFHKDETITINGIPNSSLNEVQIGPFGTHFFPVVSSGGFIHWFGSQRVLREIQWDWGIQWNF